MMPSMAVDKVLAALTWSLSAADTEHSDVEEDEVEDDDMEELVEPCDEMTLPQFQASSKK